MITSNSVGNNLIKKRLYFIRRKNLKYDIITCKKCGFIYNTSVDNCPNCGVLKESLQYIKFHYTNYKHDKRPKVKVLDHNYLGQINQKSYGKRKDILGYNLNYVKNRKEAIKAIDDISNFGDMLSNNKEEKYRRIKYFFPEQSKFIRRYMKKHMKGIKEKNGLLWKKIK